MKPNVLFVDDEPNILRGLRRSLRSRRSEWDMAFASSAPEALQIIDSSGTDVVVTDMRMPGMNGAELLKEVARCAPKAIRFVLSGQTDEEHVMNLVGISHQFLSKPCDINFLAGKIEQALALRDLLEEEKVQSLAAGLSDLPSSSAVYDKLVEELGNGEPSIAIITALVSQDMALTAKVLQIAGSGFFSMAEKMPSLTQAVERLGVGRIKSMVRSQAVVSRCDEDKIGGVSLTGLWDHSMTCAGVAQAIANAEGMEKQAVETAFVAGILHDLGILLLAANEPEKYAQVTASLHNGARSPEIFEKKMFGATHATVGAYLVGLWGFPEQVIKAVAYHHTPVECPASRFGTLTVVHAAEGLCNAYQGNAAPAELDDYLNLEYLETVGVADKLPKWQKLANELLSEVSKE